LVVAIATSCFADNDNDLKGTTDPPGGDVHAFDPIAAIPAVTQFAGGAAQLVEIDARGVRSSGTQDLDAAYYPETDYEFIRPAQQHSDLPIGAQPVSTPLERVRVQVANPNFVQVAGEGTFFNRGMKKDISSTTDEPPSSPFSPCAFAALWQVAQTKGAPPDAVARIAYSGATWKFDIANTSISLSFDEKCALAPDQ
jgi:hypothetical protein